MFDTMPWQCKNANSELEIKQCCHSGNAILAYISGTCLQNELNEASMKNGLDKFNLMDAYNAKHLEKFKERAVELQKKICKNN